MADGQVIIYALSDPRKPSVIRYIGKTAKTLHYRLRRHLEFDKHNHKTCWIKSLKSEGIKPLIWPLEFCGNENWQERERFWIQFFKPLGLLTNLKNGGQGIHGFERTYARTAAQINQFETMLRTRKKRGKLSPLSKLKLINSRKGIARTEKQKQQWEWMRSNFKPRPTPPEQLKRMQLLRHSGPRTEGEIRQWENAKKDCSRPIQCIETLEVFPSANVASKRFGITHNKIGRAIRRNGTSAGFHWRFI